MAFTGLSKKKRRSLTGIVCKERCRRKLSVLWTDCCLIRDELKRVKRGVIDMSTSLMRLMRGGEGSECADAERCLSTRSRTISARMNKGTGIFRSMRRPECVAEGQEKVLLAIRGSLFLNRLMRGKEKKRFGQLNEQKQKMRGKARV